MTYNDYAEDYEYWCECAHELPTIEGFKEYLTNQGVSDVNTAIVESMVRMKNDLYTWYKDSEEIEESEVNDMITKAIKEGIIPEDIEEIQANILKKKTYNIDTLKLKCELIQELLQDWACGLSIYEMCIKYRMSDNTIRAIIKENK